MKFHHGQKVKIVKGYYATYKGYITKSREEHKTTTVNKIANTTIVQEYFVRIKSDENIEVWLPEDFLKVAIF